MSFSLKLTTGKGKMNASTNLIMNMVPLVMLSLTMTCLAAVYHIDSAQGNDAQDGLSPETAWKSLQNISQAEIQPGDRILFKRGGLWRGTFALRNGAAGKPVVFGNYGDGPLPIIQDSLAMDMEDDWEKLADGNWSTRKAQAGGAAGQGTGHDIAVDVGNIILDHGAVPCPRKKWKAEELKNDLDYYHDRELHRVVMKSEQNPALRFSSIEMALHHGCVIFHGDRHDVVVDGLAIRYGAAHGFGGSGAKNIVIRNCDIYYIGGALQYFREGKYPVRYGNGIEFWETADNCLVENNRIWEIYDAALTPQGKGSPLTNITFRNNLVWNAEFSFEYWNGKGGRTANVIFENNTCVDAGHGWAHTHRPDPNGAHLMFYSNLAQMDGFIVRNNIFADTTDWGMRQDVSWMDAITLRHNLWYTADKPVYALNHLGSKYYMTDGFLDAIKIFHQDYDSIFAKPVFVDAKARDYRLKPDSPGFTEKIGRQTMIQQTP